jgi:hypothetical protein
MEKVRATKKKEILWDPKKLLTRIGKGLNHGKPTTTI